MSRLKLCTLLALLLLTSCGATLRLSGTAPTQDNDGSCPVPVLVPNVSASVWVHVAWVGASSGEDSMSVARSAPFIFTRSVQPGSYTIRAWASDAGGASCDTLIYLVLKSPPHRPQVTP
jgi:hypothetical protein